MSLTRTIALSQNKALTVPTPPVQCLSVVYAWRRFPWIQSHIPILADTSPRSLTSMNLLSSAPLVMQPKARGKPVVRVARRYERCGGSSGEFSSESSQSPARNLGHINKRFRIRTNSVIRPLPTQRSAPTRPLPRHPPVHPTPHSAPEDVENVLHGMRLLREFDEEARALSALRGEFSASAKQLLECSICMDKMPADSFARIDTCGHTFCRECLCGHVTARLEEHRFPIPCPTCTADRGKGKNKAGGTFRLQMVIAVAPHSAT